MVGSLESERLRQQQKLQKNLEAKINKRNRTTG